MGGPWLKEGHSPLPGETVAWHAGIIEKSRGLIVERITVEGGRVETTAESIRIEGGTVEIIRRL